MHGGCLRQRAEGQNTGLRELTSGGVAAESQRELMEPRLQFSPKLRASAGHTRSSRQTEIFEAEKAGTRGQPDSEAPENFHHRASDSGADLCPCPQTSSLAHQAPSLRSYSKAGSQPPPRKLSADAGSDLTGQPRSHQCRESLHPSALLQMLQMYFCSASPQQLCSRGAMCRAAALPVRSCGAELSSAICFSPSRTSDTPEGKIRTVGPILQLPGHCQHSHILTAMVSLGEPFLPAGLRCVPQTALTGLRPRWD